MSIDLKGNTNFAFLKNLNGDIIVPRTNLAAVDLTVANGLAVLGSTMSIVMATADDIQNGTSGSVVTPDALKPILDGKQTALEAGTGIEIVSGETASTISVPITDVDTLIDGTTATKIVDVAALRGALTTGQAVDVTSVPDQTITGDYKGTFTTTSTTLGFASFPKYASGLQYLMIADVTVTDARNITPSGTWLDGSTSALALAANTSTRVAMLFNAANKGKFTFSGSGTVTVSNLREYEVTACTAESIAYIASLSNPDAFADYYLVKADMVQPWTYIIDMGTSPAVTIAAGLSYKLNASTGTHTLTVDTCPAGYDGKDSIIRIRLGGAGVVQAVAPLQLGDALVPYAINNCVVKFRDGEAVLLVEDTLAGYVVTVTSGTDNGSLAYGLAATGIPYIAFSTGTDRQVVDMGNAVTANEEVTVVGNGYTNTTITGNITCTNKTTVANLSLQDVTIAGGTMTLGDAFIPSGSTVSVSGGWLAIEKVTGDEGVIDLGGTRVNISSGFTANASGVSFLVGGGENGGAIYCRGSMELSGCTLTSNTATNYGGAIYCAGNGSLTDCTVTNNTASFAGGAAYVGGSMTLSGCSIYGNGGNTRSPNVEVNAGHLYASGGNYIESIKMFNNGTVTLANTNKVDLVNYYSDSNNGSITIADGAVVDLTGNTNETPINPGGGITFESDGATLRYDSGGSTIDGYVPGCSCMSIISGGTVYFSKGAALTGTSVSSCTLDFSKGFYMTLNGSLTVVDARLIATSGSGNGRVIVGSSASGSNTFSNLTLSGTCQVGVQIANIASAYGGTVTIADNTTVSWDGLSYGSWDLIKNVGTLIIGSNVVFKAGSNQPKSMTAGTYTDCSVTWSAGIISGSLT